MTRAGKYAPVQLSLTRTQIRVLLLAADAKLAIGSLHAGHLPPNTNEWRALSGARDKLAEIYFGKREVLHEKA